MHVIFFWKYHIRHFWISLGWFTSLKISSREYPWKVPMILGPTLTTFLAYFGSIGKLNIL